MFDELWENWNWSPIRNCPGRFILRGVKDDLSPQKLLGSDVKVIEHRVVAAKDLVLVAALDKGGLISYKRADGSFLHTLNTPEGFRRKLQQLGINPI
ncbi:MAG: hypothetical protein AUG51_24095 [Acidobacteria bacterium 13_1_20CM_3_53_8]|nr:MAG: hypothetical protein AUG51_24095 [Acidobacteria bacterium 13_1_20CM_3_53_8]